MKKVLLLLLLLSVSCQKDEIKNLYYEYDADQPTTIVANVVIMEHSIVTFESMEQEVNADYFHRYGIHIQLNLDENRVSLEDETKFGNRIFLPKKRDTLTIYIVPSDYIKVIGAAAYALPYSKAVVIGDRSIRTRTLAHEIGHVYGLGHLELDNNVMTPFQIAAWRERPNDFENWQIDTILQNLDSDTYAKKEQIILD